MKPTVSTLYVETDLKENVQREISLSRVIDVITRVFENQISSESDITSYGIPAVDDVEPSFSLLLISFTLFTFPSAYYWIFLL